MRLIIAIHRAHLIRLALAAFAGWLIVASSTHANSQDKPKPKADLVRCSITVPDRDFSERHAAIVQIEIENISDRDIKLWAEYKFELKRIESIGKKFETVGDSYYSRSGIAATNGQLALIPKDLNKMVRINRNTSRFVNEEVHLKKGETKRLDVDLTKLLWADSLSSYWPSDKFSELIPKGKYRLWLEMSGEEVGAVSNQVDIEIR